jgi:hypothetical protein
MHPSAVRGTLKIVFPASSHRFIATAPGTTRKRNKRGSAYSQVKTEIGSACITHFDPDLAPASASASALALVLVPVLACAWRPCLADFLAGPATLVPAVHAGLPLAVAAACDLELAGVPVVERLGLTSERLRRPFAVTVSAARLNHPAGVAWNAGYPAAWNFSVRALPAFPAEAVLVEALPAGAVPAGAVPVVVLSAEQALFALPDSVAALRVHAAGNGNSA